MWAVETQGLAVRFGQYQALEDVSLRVPEGSFVAVVGPNGAGKSTLLKALLGLVPFPALALELVVSGLRRAWPFRVGEEERRRALEALGRVGALELAHRPLGRLSGGQLQRVYLARALVRRPRLLLLDEPATGVDRLGEVDLYRHLEAYQEETGATILMITHDWEAAHHASHVLVLNRRVIGFGPPERALSEECLRQAFGHLGHEHALFLGGGRA